MHILLTMNVKKTWDTSWKEYDESSEMYHIRINSLLIRLYTSRHKVLIVNTIVCNLEINLFLNMKVMLKVRYFQNN